MNVAEWVVAIITWDEFATSVPVPKSIKVSSEVGVPSLIRVGFPTKKSSVPTPVSWEPSPMKVPADIAPSTLIEPVTLIPVLNWAL